MEKLKPEYTFTDELKTKVESILSQLKQETPEAFEDGQINFDILKDLIGAESIDDEAPEHFGLNWPGKRQARRLASLPPKGTLKPCIGEGINEETTENIFIEGENLEVLKILRKSYKGKIKMIYIDPPYNTGNDFIYKDDFSEPLEDYLRKSGQKSEEGLLTTNPKSQGRYHSNWLNFMYPRLRLAKDLLSDDGVMFVSIDDNESNNLKSLLSEIFGDENFISQLVWEKKKKGAFLSNTITNVKEYILVFCKNSSSFQGLIGEINSETETYPCINASNKREIRTIKKGIESKFRESDYFLQKGSKISVTTMDLILHSDLVIKNNILAEDLIIEGNWRYTQDLMAEYAEKKELYITQDLYLRRIVSEPRYKTLKDLLSRSGDDENLNFREINIQNLFADGWGSNEDGQEEIRLLLGDNRIMDYPKPPKLILKLIASLRDPNCIVLDFFAGSGTTAQAVLDLNKIDGGNRKFICIQIPEQIPDNSVAKTFGFDYVSQITISRIKKVINNHSNIFGFKSFKLDLSNIKEWQDVQPSENRGLNLFSQLEQQNQQPIHENTKPEDLITEFMLVEGFPLQSKISKLENLNGNTVFKIIDSEIPYSLFVCLDDMIQSSTVEKLQITSKDTFICLDRSFNGNDQVKMQLDDICKLKTV